MSLYPTSEALFSADRFYRYWLWRCWDESRPLCAVIGLNPSTANEYTDDATIRRLKSLLNNNGYGGFHMLNLFTIVSSDPSVLVKHPRPGIGSAEHYMETLCVDRDVIFAWGNFKEAKERGAYVAKKYPNALCFGKNADGSPKHPLYLRGDTKLIPYHEKT